MKSMTGFGRATGSAGNTSVSVQVSSVNRKGLDLTFALPKEWNELEAPFGEAVRRVATRGKVHLTLEVAAAPGAVAAAFDSKAVEAVLARLRETASALGLPFTVTPELLWSVASSQKTSSTLPSLPEVQDALLAVVQEALRGFVAMRAQEGAALLADFSQRLALLDTGVSVIAQRAPEVTPAYREALLKRLREADLSLDVADERVLKEVALFADRCDITEELTRLRSHLQQLRALFNSAGEIGRKAEFILQEIGREVHTIGSKANDLQIARQVIELKNELERIREQVANVE